MLAQYEYSIILNIFSFLPVSCPDEKFKMPRTFLIFGQSDVISVKRPDYWYKFTLLMANSEDPDQVASSEANWSGSTLFAKAGHIRVQQDKG